MHAEILLLLLDELDELNVVVRELFGVRTLAVALCAVLAVAVTLRTGSVVLGACFLGATVTAVSLALYLCEFLPSFRAPAALEHKTV